MILLLGVGTWGPMEISSAEWLMRGPDKKCARLDPIERAVSDWAIETEMFSAFGLSFKVSAA